MSRLARLRRKLHNRLRQRDNQIKKWEETHKRGHAKEAKKHAHAVRYLRHLLGKLIRRSPSVMYDSVTVSEIPSDAQAAAGYVGGAWPTYANGELKAQCPHARLLSIAVSSSYDAECLDIEPGDATNEVAPGWVRRQQARGLKRPVVYTSASNANSLISTLSAAGIGREEYRLWTAHYAGYKHICGPTTCRYIPFDADATQWTDTSHGRNLDESWLKPGFFA